MVREKVRGKIFFQGQDIVRKLCIFELSLKSGKSLGILKEQVREKSGNFEM